MSPRRDEGEDTISTRLAPGAAIAAEGIGLTLLWHPDPARIGEQALLPEPGATLALSRGEPDFRAVGAARGAALGERCISRTPLRLHALDDGGVRIEAPASRMAVALQGRDLTSAAQLGAEDIARGAVLRLGGRVLLCLHRGTADAGLQPIAGLVGCSRAMARIQRAVRRVAATDAPVLVTGETGTGKELLAQALHALGARARGPLVAVNMAALTESLAATDLFGAARGAYTGATASRVGLFAEADGGTLFLDEIGDTPAPIQPMLLRVLEAGEYRPVGSSRAQRANVRLIAATDRDLGPGVFNQPLRRRLEAFVIALPPLRARREDIGLLLRHFLREANCSDGDLTGLPIELVETLALYDWPGNVRQLRHAAARIALALQTGSSLALGDLLQAPAASRPAQHPAQERAAPHRAPSTVSADEVLRALEGNDWCVRQAAASLGVARASFYALIEAHPLVRRAQDIPQREIEAALRQAPGQPSLWAAALRTPREALRRHIRALGLAAG